MKKLYDSSAVTTVNTLVPSGAQSIRLGKMHIGTAAKFKTARRSAGFGELTAAYRSIETPPNHSETNGKAMQVFSAAVDARPFDRGPFERLPSATHGNEDRKFFVPVEWIDRCINHAPCGDWRSARST